MSGGCAGPFAAQGTKQLLYRGRIWNIKHTPESQELWYSTRGKKHYLHISLKLSLTDPMKFLGQGFLVYRTGLLVLSPC